MTFLVAGATGNVGRHVVAELVASGQHVRALTRNPEQADLPGAVLVVGDLNDAAALKPALDGVTGLHLFGSGAEGAFSAEIVDLAVAAGVRRVTVLWGGYQGPVEEAVRRSGLEWTILEAAEFMSNTLAWAPGIREEGVVREAFGDERSAIVHEGDVGRVAATILAEGGHGGRSYSVTGPEVLTVHDKVAIIGEGIGQRLKFDELTTEQARARMRDAGHPEDVVDFVIGWHANPPEAAYTVVPAVQDVTGTPARTLAEWTAGHKGFFSS